MIWFTLASKLDQLRQKTCFNLYLSTGFSLVIAFYYTWKLSLAILAFIPLQALGSFFESKVIKDSENPMTESEMRRGTFSFLGCVLRKYSSSTTKMTKNIEPKTVQFCKKRVSDSIL